MNGLSLFSGTGIGELAFKHIFPDYRTIGYVEWDKYCQAVLRARIRDAVLDDAPIFGDIRQFNHRFAGKYRGKVDWLSAGFPCTPFSVAGRQAGEADERNMWPATRSAIGIIQPEYVFLENVPGLLSNKYIRTIFGQMAEIGYDCEWDIVSAAFVGAAHIRKRLWILAYPVNVIGDSGTKSAGRATGTNLNRSGARSDVANPQCVREQQSQGGVSNQRRRTGDQSQDVANSNFARQPNIQRCGKASKVTRERTTCNTSWWQTEPDVGRMVNGLANRAHRLKALGNGWVPQVVARILEVDK